jgi:mono/diheme cytochrome c family protein
MKMTANLLSGLSLMVIALAMLPNASQAEAFHLKPDDTKLVTQGKAVYLDNCASCHGVNLEGQIGWRDQKVDGMRLAPPHDQSGHTWHHPDALLFDLTKYGLEAMIGRAYPNNMAVFDGVLSDEAIIASLSYIKSTWPKDIRDIHDNINQEYDLNKN